MSLKSEVDRNYTSLKPEMTLGDVVKKVSVSRRKFFPVLNDKKELKGVITLNSIRNINTINDLYDNKNSIDQQLNINGHVINIGTPNSVVNINGTTTYVAVNELVITDKIISLNLNNSTLSGFDNGGLCGFEILGTNGDGFIKTSEDATRYLIKAPNQTREEYITTTDLNNNFIVSGYTILNNNITANSNLNIKGIISCKNQLNLVNLSNDQIMALSDVNNGDLVYNTTTQKLNVYINGTWSEIGNTESIDVKGTASFLGSTTIGSDLYITGNSICTQNITGLANLNILGDTVLQGKVIVLDNISLLSNLAIAQNVLIQGNSNIINNSTISGNSIIYGNSTIGSNLNVNGTTILQGNTTILSVNISRNSTFQNNLNVSGNSIFQNNVTLISNLNVSSNSTFQGNSTILANINISGFTTLQGNSTALANINVSGNTILQGNSTILANLNISGNSKINF